MDKSHLSPNTQGRPQSRSESGQPFHGGDDHSVRSTNISNFTNKRKPHKLVLCFDGTGNKFKGDDSDSNILKIFRCLDRESDGQYHYYQPGIGTYVVSTSLSHTSMGARMRSWYLKAKDSAVGSSFDQHVVGGYRFLMRFYCPGDEIYFFGFSRGAYVARFLAEMLDYVGLLSHGNEEMVAFAWKAFSRWQSRRTDNSERGEEKKKEMYRFMKGFRETFSRPVKRIRFLGLFDTVNSVPRFETAWMQRSKFPYTARSSAKVIRHCVSIDERRAKFRQDLMYQNKGDKGQKKAHRNLHDMVSNEKYRARKAAAAGGGGDQFSEKRGRQSAASSRPNEKAWRPHSRSRSRPPTRDSIETQSDLSHAEFDYDSDSEDDEQNIDEIWFAGGHGDVGGGWEFIAETKSASHIPLTYMIREAQKAGLNFDLEKLAEMGCAPSPEEPIPQSTDWGQFSSSGGEDEKQEHKKGEGEDGPHNPFHAMMHKAHVARIHDSLEYGSGLNWAQVMAWKVMEYLPFRRMDLQPDGSWRPIRWPLPCGEVRDIPMEARVHGSVIRRMQRDERYRPGNLIVGGGGRGMRVAPKDVGMGEWECVAEEGDPIGEVW
ncbi:hypothetical protein BX600DRAFT_390425 [Xylariales sp. PMI_506]|nr:hypothetical protein BX600DRAFT_390425 [Xylariales sp. PMI_506]